MTLEEFNNQTKDKASADLFKCCGSTRWLDKLMKQFPFVSIEDLKISSDRTWFSCSEKDWLEAFSHHPKIGQNKVENEKFSSTKEWAEQEQSNVKNANKIVIAELAEANKLYEKFFGFIFIVCATGKSAQEILEILNERLNNPPAKELHIAAGEQNKITHLRIDKLLS